jgi:hypothetical protein
MIHDLLDSKAGDVPPEIQQTRLESHKVRWNGQYLTETLNSEAFLTPPSAVNSPHSVWYMRKLCVSCSPVCK